MAKVFLSLGSNLGDRLKTINLAIVELEKLGKLLKKSSLYETEPWGNADQPWFLNAVVVIDTALEPLQILDETLRIEKSLGRTRKTEKDVYLPREIDIDILFYDNLVFESDTLNIPHPHIADRRFVLTMLDEIAPDFVHPTLKKTPKQLLNECEDKAIVRPLSWTHNN